LYPKNNQFVTESGAVRFEVLRVVTVRSLFLDVILCSPMKVGQCFRGTYRLHLQG
jgi:hypothetical protein